MGDWDGEEVLSRSVGRGAFLFGLVVLVLLLVLEILNLKFRKENEND